MNIFLYQVAQSENTSPLIRDVAKMMSTGVDDDTIKETLVEKHSGVSKAKIRETIDFLLDLCPASPSPF